MADTHITNTPERIVVLEDSGAQWLVAALLIIALAVGALILYRSGIMNSAPAEEPDEAGLNINVTVPPMNGDEQPAN